MCLASFKEWFRTKASMSDFFGRATVLWPVESAGKKKPMLWVTDLDLYCVFLLMILSL